MIKRSIDVRHELLLGALAGLTAGLVLTLLMTVMAAGSGRDVWYGIKGAAAPFLGARAMRPGFDALAAGLGLLCHLAVSVGWGVLFALLVARLRTWATLGAGVAWGFVVWIGMYYVILPIVGLASMRHDAPVGRAIAFHVFFSVVTALALILYRKLLPEADVPERLRTARPAFGRRRAGI